MGVQTVILTLPQAGQIQIYSGNVEADIDSIGTVGAAVAVTGTLSKPSKMPCPGYSIPASSCRTGSKLKHVPGSTCFNCYAADDPEWLQQEGRVSSFNHYIYPACRKGLGRRLESLRHPLWVPAMILQIRRYATDGHFRWHDSGDIQGIEHLRNIAIIAEHTDVLHWIPTREYRDLDRYLELFGDFPDNLIVRVSAHFVEEGAPKRFPLSSIVVEHSSQTEFNCPAPKQDKECRDCRACWDPNVKTVAYRIH
jgi:hypothetical protein